MTDERVDWLLKAVNKSDFVLKDIYLDILQRWEKADFSRVDKDHNDMWKKEKG